MDLKLKRDQFSTKNNTVHTRQGGVPHVVNVKRTRPFELELKFSQPVGQKELFCRIGASHAL